MVTPLYAKEGLVKAPLYMGVLQSGIRATILEPVTNEFNERSESNKMNLVYV